MKKYLSLAGIIVVIIFCCLAALKISDNKYYVYSREKLAINYSKGINRSQLLAQNIKIQDSKGISVKIAVDFLAGSDRIVIITPPKDGYELNKNYKLYINSDISFDVEGKTLKKNTLEFTAKKDKEMHFSDKNLDTAVRNQINKKNGTIYKSEIYKIYSLNGENYNIIDLEGIENFTNLKVLTLSNNGIKKINEIKSLKQLEYLSLVNNKIKDISPLKDLKNLKTLWLKGNDIVDYSPAKKYFDKLTAKDFKIK